MKIYCGMSRSSVTTIQIDTALKARLDRLKSHPLETYNEVVARLVDMVSDDEPLDGETPKRIETAIADLRNGHCVSAEEIDRELGL
jgi:predicted transcriptional regulator